MRHAAFIAPCCLFADDSGELPLNCRNGITAMLSPVCQSVASLVHSADPAAASNPRGSRLLVTSARTGRATRRLALVLLPVLAECGALLICLHRLK